jgi:hypothetical protein
VCGLGTIVPLNQGFFLHRNLAFIDFGVVT